MSELQSPQDFVRLWAAESRRIYAYIMTLHPHTADADEIFQETALTVWQKFSEFPREGSFRAWACAIARNKVGSFRQLRRHSTVAFGDRFVDLIEGLLASKAEVLDAQHEALADCFAKLSARDQRLIELRYQEGATVKSVAERVQRSVDAVYKALNRIHTALLDCVIAATAHRE